tara:strand:+ start:350 stop:1132 length:783 start_codon:yes stop_codon:yes gene_type:complete
LAKEKASQDFARAIQRVQTELVSQIFDLRTQGMTRSEIVLVLQTLDMEDLILNQLNLRSDLDNLMLEYQSVLGSMEMTGAVTDEVLTALLRMDNNTFMKQIGLMGDQVRNEAARGIIAGASEADIAQSILKGAGGVLRPDQAETLANTALNTFERNVTVEMASNDPKDTRYIYQGPVDDKTRDICIDMMSAGALTRDEVDSDFPGAFSDGGGFNCRHRWARETSSSDKLSDQKGAEKLKSKKQDEGKWKTPQTPQQQFSE